MLQAGSYQIMAGDTMNVVFIRSLALCVLLALAACDAGSSPRPPLEGARIGAPFTLTDQDGRRFSDRQLAGRYRILYFGYTYCPDICPTDVQNIAAGLRLFEQAEPARGARVTPVFITIDPARDRPAALKQFVGAFHPRFVALTGSDAEIAAVAKAFAVYYRRADGGTADAYDMDHSRQAYLLDPDGKPLALLPQDESPQAVAAELANWVR